MYEEIDAHQEMKKPPSERHRAFVAGTPEFMARIRTKFSPDLVEIILEATRRGAPKTLAAQCAGVSAQAVNGWLRRGRDAEEVEDYDDPYYVFLKQYEIAAAARGLKLLEKVDEIIFGEDVENRDRVNMLKYIMSGGDLAQHFSKERKVHHEISGKDGGPIEITGIDYSFTQVAVTAPESRQLTAGHDDYDPDDDDDIEDVDFTEVDDDDL